MSRSGTGSLHEAIPSRLRELVDLTSHSRYRWQVPLIDIEVVGNAGLVEPGLPGRIADVVGEVLGAGPGTTWVRVRELECDHYGESGGPIPADLRPVFVQVLLARQDEAGEIGSVLEQVTHAVAEVLQSPAHNVHVMLSPDGAGRVAFGGRLVQ